MATPHNKAEYGEIAGTVLMPGDPLRAKFIAENFLTNVNMFNDVRNMFGYTGEYNGKKISVMGSGMGMPSIGIYSYELFEKYGVDNIIRIGSAGSYSDDLKVFDVVLADSVYSESSYARTMNGCEDNIVYPDTMINELVEKKSAELGIDLKKVRIHSSDVFYRLGDENYYIDLRDRLGCKAVEMESFALFYNASVLGKRAVCLLTISDSFVSDDETTAEEREKSFTEMIKLALNTASEL